MTILVDMDDVLEQLAVAWIEYVNEHFGTSVSIQDTHAWDLSLAFPTLTKEQVYSAELDDALWSRVKPMPGADEGLRRLIAAGHEIYIVTATYYKTLPAKMEEVLFRYFPYIDWEHVIITSNKQMIKGDILIDDGPHNLSGGDYYRILFEAHHNKEFDESSIGAVRVKSWREACERVEEYVNKLKG